MDPPVALHAARVEPPWDLDAWRVQARAALCAQVEPAQLAWSDDLEAALFAASPVAALPARGAPPNVPREFLSLAARVLAHRQPQRHGLLYRLLWRLTHGEPRLLAHAVDRDVHRARELEKSVRRDLHKMKAFVRFRAVPGQDDAYVAWFEPEHHIVDLVAPFFMRRFAGMRWAILTPYRSATWDGDALRFGAGAMPADAPADDASESLWQTYYASIFNPARLNPRMMRQEMPQKYWKHLPETHLLPGLLRDAGARVRDMAQREQQAPRKPAMVARAAAHAARIDVPPVADLDALRAAAADCRACPLWQPATQTVFGEGPADARVMVVGEQPGDVEDLRGRPFVGPAGRLFDRALAEIGIDRAKLYVTNAVKHFKFEQRGKVRMHSKPAPAEQRACRQWLQRERATVRPHVIVCLGATAAEAVLGKGFKLMEQRGQWQTLSDGTRAMATVHPAWVLRQSGADGQVAAYRGFVQDLALLRDTVRNDAASGS